MNEVMRLLLLLRRSTFPPFRSLPNLCAMLAVTPVSVFSGISSVTCCNYNSNMKRNRTRKRTALKPTDLAGAEYAEMAEREKCEKISQNQSNGLINPEEKNRTNHWRQ